MNVVLDACSIINLINGKVLQKIVAIPKISFFIGDNLLDGEILDVAQKMMVETLIANKSIRLLQSVVTLTDFITLKEKYDLGDGETECIALCKNLKYHIATDDLKARISSKKELGDTLVVGSLFLLREAVRSAIVECHEAQKSYLLMKSKGGFLPKIDESYFCK